MRCERARGADILKLFFFFFFPVHTCKPASHFEALTVFSKSESERARNPEFGNQIPSGPRPLVSCDQSPYMFSPALKQNHVGWFQ